MLNKKVIVVESRRGESPTEDIIIVNEYQWMEDGLYEWVEYEDKYEGVCRKIEKRYSIIPV